MTTQPHDPEAAGGCPAAHGTGVTRPTQWLDRLGLSTGTLTMRRCGSPAARAYPCIIWRYVRTSGPPMSNARLTSAGIVAEPTR